jgi:hypothetical protein
VLTDARERQVWRVEASAGRFAGVGVYDLCADRASSVGVDSGVVGGAGPGTGSQWRLLRVAD